MKRSFHPTIIYVIAGVLLLGLHGCGTLRSSLSSTQRNTSLPTSATSSDFLSHYKRLSPPAVVDAKGRVSISYNNHHVDVPLRWSLNRDQAFIVSLRALGVMEVGKLSLTPHDVVVLDRIGKRGIHLSHPYSTLAPYLTPWGIDTRVLNAWLQHDPFSLTQTGIAALSQMKMTTDDLGNYIFSLNKKGQTITHYFDPTYNLVRSTLHHKGALIGDATYSDFVTLIGSTRPYPRRLTLHVAIPSRKQELRVSVELSAPSTTMSQQSEAGLPSTYTPLTIEDLKAALKTLF